MFCTSCGAKLPDNAGFCAQCGTRINNSLVQPTVNHSQNPQVQPINSEQPRPIEPNRFLQSEEDFYNNPEFLKKEKSSKSKKTIATILTVIAIPLYVLQFISLISGGFEQILLRLQMSSLYGAVYIVFFLFGYFFVSIIATILLIIAHSIKKSANY